MVKLPTVCILFLCLLTGTKSKTFGIEQDLNKFGNEAEAEVFDVVALYDHTANVVLYKDPTVPACFIQSLQNVSEDESTDHEILLVGKHFQGSVGVTVSQFQKEFCSNLPLFQMESRSNATHSRRRVHRARRRRNTGGYSQHFSHDTTRNNQEVSRSNHNRYHWPGSQTHIEGDVNGNGYFSGQAQSTSGLSQSQIQLGGVGLTGRISSIAGGAQSALRLGTKSGSGQIASSGSGPLASELQLNLGEPGHESRANAVVMQEHHSGSGSGQNFNSQDFLAGQPQQQYHATQIGSGFSGHGSSGSLYRKHSFSENYNQRFPPSSFSQTAEHESGHLSNQGFSPYLETEHQRGTQQDRLAQEGHLQQTHEARGQVPSTGSNGHRTGFRASTSRVGTTSKGQEERHHETAVMTGGSRQTIYQQVPQSRKTEIHGEEAQFRTDSISVKEIPNEPSSHQFPGSGQRRDQIKGSNLHGHQSSPARSGFRVSNGPHQTPSHQVTSPETRSPNSHQYPIQSRPAYDSGRIESAHEERMSSQPPAPRTGIPGGRTSTSARRVQDVQITQTDLSAVQRGRQLNGNVQRANMIQTQYGGGSQQHDIRGHETQTELSAVFQEPDQSGQTPRTSAIQTNYGGDSEHGRIQDVHEAQTDVSAVFQAPQQNGHTQRNEPIQHGSTFRSASSQTHQIEEVQTPMFQRQSHSIGEFPKTSYPITNGRRVYQRRTVTYYPGQATPVSQHYVQQTMTGNQPQSQFYTPPNGHSLTSQTTAGDNNCHTLTFQCTIIFDNNGKSKLCQPKPVGSTPGHSNICCC